MLKPTLPSAVVRAVMPLMNRVVACGAAVSCAVGIGLGAWLAPPALPGASAATVVNLPVVQGVDSDDGGGVSPLSYAQPESDVGADQTAAVSPPAAAAPASLALAQADVQPQPAVQPDGASDRVPDNSRNIDADPDTGAGKPPIPPATVPRGGDPIWYGPAPSAGDDG